MEKLIKYLHKKYWKQFGKRKIRRRFKNIKKEYFRENDKKFQFHEDYLI